MIPTLDASRLAAYDREIEQSTLEARFDWANRHAGRSAALTTSFGIQSAVMLHLWKSHCPESPIIFIDSGFLFPETYAYAETLKDLLGLEILTYRPLLKPHQIVSEFGKLWEQGSEGIEKYSYLTKIEPLQRAFTELQITLWLSGIRREQSSERSRLLFIVEHAGVMKMHPILDKDTSFINRYMTTFGLPEHPLKAQGYATVGDYHSSVPLSEGQHEEQTRFNGIKRECGLHDKTWFKFAKEPTPWDSPIPQTSQPLASND